MTAGEKCSLTLGIVGGGSAELAVYSGTSQNSATNNPMSPTRTAIYLRALPDEDPNPHLAELREFAFALGLDIVGEFIDTGGAGDKLERKKLDAVETLVEGGAVQVLLTTELHRLTRHSTHDMLYLLQQMAGSGVRVIATRDDIDTDEPRGQALIEAAQLVATIDKEMARQRIMSGLEQARKRPGYKHGRPRGVSTEAVVDLHKKGLTVARIAKELGVSPTTVKSRLSEWRRSINR